MTRRSDERYTASLHCNDRELTGVTPLARRGLPPDTPSFDGSLARAAVANADAWLASEEGAAGGGASAAPAPPAAAVRPADFATWDSMQRQMFLERLQARTRGRAINAPAARRTRSNAAFRRSGALSPLRCQRTPASAPVHQHTHTRARTHVQAFARATAPRCPAACFYPHRALSRSVSLSWPHTSPGVSLAPPHLPAPLSSLTRALSRARSPLAPLARSAPPPRAVRTDDRAAAAAVARARPQARRVARRSRSGCCARSTTRTR